MKKFFLLLLMLSFFDFPDTDFLYFSVDGCFFLRLCFLAVILRNSNLPTVYTGRLREPRQAKHQLDF